MSFISDLYPVKTKKDVCNRLIKWTRKKEKSFSVASGHCLINNVPSVLAFCGDSLCDGRIFIIIFPLLRAPTQAGDSR